MSGADKAAWNPARTQSGRGVGCARDQQRGHLRANRPAARRATAFPQGQITTGATDPATAEGL